MEEPTDIISRSIRISKALHRKVKTEASRRGITIERAYSEALNEWLSPSAAQPGNIMISCPPKLRSTIRRLIVVLNQPGVFEAFRGNAELGIVEDVLGSETEEEDDEPKNGTEN